MIITYQGHVENYGWTAPVSDGETAGTVGQGLRLEALKVTSDYRVRCQAHVQNIGWMDWVGNDEVAGTEGQGLRMEAFRIELLDPPEEKHVWYRAHVENVGWTDWTIDGAIAGSVGESLRLEAIEIQIVDAASNDEFSKWYENHRKCKLGDVIFSSTSSESATMSNEITDKPIEGGNVSDHAVNKPLVMSISGVIIGDDCQDKLQMIRDYVTKKELLRYVGVDTAKNMLIETFSTKRTVSMKGGVAFDLSLKEIRIATGLVMVIDEAYVSTQANSVTNGGLQSSADIPSAESLNSPGLSSAVNLTYFDLSTSGPGSSGVIEIVKTRIPCAIDVRCPTKGSPLPKNLRQYNTFEITFHYNPSGDFFTYTAINKDTGNAIASGIKLDSKVGIGYFYRELDGIGADLIWQPPAKDRLKPPRYHAGWNEIGDSLKIWWRTGDE